MHKNTGKLSANISDICEKGRNVTSKLHFS